MSTRLTFDINGKPVTAEFYSGYFKKHFKELSGIDILKDNIDSILSVDGMMLGAKMLVAGNMAEKSLTRSYPAPAADTDVNTDDVEHWLLAKDMTEAYKIIADMIAIIYKPVKSKEDKPGEAIPQVEQS